MRRNRRVKIVATLGPASTNEETMRRLFEAGADVFRVNMSHATHDGLREVHAIVRKLESEFSRPIGILVDLQGPKLRIGKLDSGSMRLTKGDILSFVRREAIGGLGRVQLPHPEIFEAVEKGHTLLLDDGKLKLRVVEASDVRIDAEVLTSGLLAAAKASACPTRCCPSAPPQDRADIECAMSLGVAWVALSFVQRPEDIAEARKLSRGRTAIMAKIEKPSAVNHLKEILELADGIMVARGDLGVEMPVEKVPGLQKQISRAARNAGKPVVVATQMLESMIYAPVPTRAEVSDVATAVFEGADAVMLSAESAVGKYPVDAVATMDRVAIEVERDPLYAAIIHAQRIDPQATGADAISAAARTVAETLNLAAIVCYTASGATSLRAARERPQQPILALTPIPATGRKLAIVWGLHCVLTDDPRNLDDMVAKACRIAYQEEFALPGQQVIISAGVPLGKSGATNLLRIAEVQAGTEE
ncbi:pyruvate kinase [Methyloceanibacter marginalis]|uniref:Pyruvate kinase n=1 Tax=Methyloceanibacter marginalis TaxID=1774971 RepID=A0A1E3WBC3_9HYPH|nr:pyruvate kinase [Methyloceanibacter marginalis]ODS03105.1 pyruvate kinase [Methyloceanibacter marginalis]